jgi:hypothetical protein
MASAAVVNNPPVAPHSVLVFPQRDFVSASGFSAGSTYTVSVIHPSGTTVSTASGIAPKDDPSTPGFDGIIEVNHPGGVCWTGVTPDIRPGDKVRVTNDADGNAEETTVANVTAQRPVQTGPDSVEVHGTAQNADGTPIDVTQLEQRLVIAGDTFANGRRTLRATSAAGSDGTLSYDAASSTNWTATYTGLSAADVTKALAAESRILWLGTAPAAVVEQTVYENGAGVTAGPAAPCTAPLEKLPPPPGSETTPPSVPTSLKATANTSNVTLDWTASTDNVGVTDYGVYRDGVAIATVQNVDGSAPAPTTFVDKNVAPGTHTYTVDAGDAVGNRSLQSAPATATAGLNPANPATAPAPTAPHSLIAFPARDFISATGYKPGTAYTFSVIRDGNVISTSTPVVADSTGLAEVNHPGGACWEGTTPNIRPGDVVRITDTGTGGSEQSTVAGVTDERPIVTSVDPVTGGGTIEVHGTAQDASGAPLPVDQIEQRLVANRDLFDLNGRRTIRAANAAGSDGTLSYDPVSATNPAGVKWTAKYTVQTPDDLARAAGGKSTSGTEFAGAESRVLWLGAAPAAGTELTIYENGPGVIGGPAAGIAGCTSGAAEKPAAGAQLSAAPKFGTTTAVASTSAAQDVTITNNGDAPLHIGRAYLAGLNPGDFKITDNPADGATVPAGASVTVRVAFQPSSAGTRQANLSFTDDAANTTDQTVPLVASTPADTTPKATAPVQSLAAVFNDPISVLSPIKDSTIPVDLTWTGDGSTYELQMATGPSTASIGAFQPVALTANTATSTRVRLAMGTGNTGNAYQFRVRSCTASVCGAWANGPKFSMVPVDDAGMAPGQFKGTWSNVTLAGTYGGSVRRASGSAQATIVPAVTYTVSGNAAWVSTLGPDQGLAQVQVDNGRPEVVDLYSATPQVGRVVWARDAMAPGTHTVTVTVLGKKSPVNPGACNTGAKCAQVDIDMTAMIK